MKIKVDGKVYPTKKKAKQVFLEAMIFCEGSEGRRMSYAYACILSGCTCINTYDEIAM